jgi:hypothetical protein
MLSAIEVGSSGDEDDIRVMNEALRIYVCERSLCTRFRNTVI